MVGPGCGGVAVVLGPWALCNGLTFRPFRAEGQSDIGVVNDRLDQVDARRHPGSKWREQA